MAPVAELIATAIQEIPKRGAIQGSILTRLQSLVCMLCEPKLILRHGQRMLEGKTNASDILNGLLEPAMHEHLEEAGFEPDPIPHAGITTPRLESHGLW